MPFLCKKDAVKCRFFAAENDWYIPVSVQMPADFCQQLDELLEDRVGRKTRAESGNRQ